LNVIHSTHDSERPLRLHLRDAAATERLGKGLAEAVAPGLRVYLIGNLGAGKTTLVRALLRGLGFPGRVKSPSYALVELYTVSRLNLYHFDFFRFRDPNEWSESGFRDYFTGEAICLVEWPDKAGGLLPPPDLEILLSSPGEGRDALLTAHTRAGEKCLEAASQLKLPEGCS
jgi:tRNA threonylcarbamoyladenosine biosynthesis protein TsaE